MSRHRSSAAEQLLGLLFLICAGVIGGTIATAQFVWRIYTAKPDYSAEQGSDGHDNSN